MPLLHADRQRSLSKGDVVELTAADPTGQDDLDELITDYFPTGLSRHGHTYLCGPTHQLDHIAAGGIAADQVQHRANAEIELIVELVRRTVAPDAPSRYTSLFACDSAKALRTWPAGNKRVTRGKPAVRRPVTRHFAI